MRRLKPRVVLYLALLALAAAPAAIPTAAAQPVGTAFTYQGQLIDAGSPANGTYDFQFILYDAAVGGSQVGPIVTSDDVTVANGLFTVPLDFGAVFAGTKRFLDIGVRPGTSTGTYTPLAGRQELTPSPNAVFSSATPWTGVTGKPPGFADNLDNDVLGGLSCVSGQVAKWSGTAWACAADTDSGGDITAVTAGTGLTGGGTTGPVTLNVNFAGSGAATTASRSDHDHFGQIWAPASAPALDGLTINTNSTVSGQAAVVGIHSAASARGYGLWSRTLSTNGVAVHGEALATSGVTVAVEGLSTSPNAYGVYGVALAPTGNTYGVWGESRSSTGQGVVGKATTTVGNNYGVDGTTASSTGVGVLGDATATTGTNYGVLGQSASSNGYGVYGHGTAPSGGLGVVGRSDGTNTTAVYGLSVATSGTTLGVLGESFSTGGKGVYGYASATTGFNTGVQGWSNSSSGYGVVGSAVANTGNGIGVWGGASSSGGLAGYFSGSVTVTGFLSKLGGGFKIDHPLDPENKYLYHSFVESPDMKNVYDGVVTTDDAGEATVELPEWFEAVNRDFRYQLTVIDDGPAFVLAKVVRKVSANRFTLRTSAPGVEVSWQVTGIRKDDWAEAHRVVVEVEKPPHERGKYLTPVEHGQPLEKGVDYERQKQMRDSLPVMADPPR